MIRAIAALAFGSFLALLGQTDTTTPLPQVPSTTAPPLETETERTAPPTSTSTAPTASSAPSSVSTVTTVPPERLREIAALRGELDALAANLHSAEEERVRLETLYRTNQVRAEATRARLVEARVIVERRAVAAYKGHRVQMLSVVLGSETADSLTSRRFMLEAVFASDAATLASFRDVSARLASEEGALRALNERQIEAAREVLARRDTLVARLADAERLVKAQLAPGAVQTAPLPVNGFVFPIGHPHTFTSTFGDYRAGPPVHPHAGNDILAPLGTPLFACVDGVIEVAEGGLGGRMVVLTAQDGTYYLYAHLSDWAAGIVTGVRVRAGQVVGFNGDSGNALGGAPHLHFEIHPGGGPALDPYPVLVAADRSSLESLFLPPPPLVAAPVVTETITPLPDLPDLLAD